MQQVQRKAPRKIEQDAISLLIADHKKVKTMFQDFAKLTRGEDNDDKKDDLVEQICVELTLHAQIEEELFYPAVREAIDDDDLMDEADVEHASTKVLIEQLEAMQAGDDHYDAKVTVLGEQIDHHVKEEQDTMFPKARKAGIDLIALGMQMLERKEGLRDE